MPPAPTLESFLTRQPPATLVQILLELAQAHEPVAERLTRLQLADRPDKLAAGFRKTLAAMQQTRKYHDYREAPAFGRMLEDWLEQVARELQPKDPPADEWPPRLMALFNSDDYGAREELLL
jgi:hypothetical protein